MAYSGLDVSVAYNRYKFLGHEFLTWVWFTSEKEPERFGKYHTKQLSIQIGNKIKLENNRHQVLETITIKGDEAGLEEGILALRKGALVTELNLILAIENQLWQFTITGEGLNFKNLKTPTTGAIEGKADIEGYILEKTYLYEEVIRVLDNLYTDYLNVRLTNTWIKKTVPKIKAWIHT